MDPIIRHESPYGGDYVLLPRAATTTVLKKGWLLSLESNAITNMNAVGEDATFAGVAYTNHATGDPHDVTALLKCMLSIDVTSATFDLGAGLFYTSGSATVDYKVAADGGNNTIANAARIYTSAVTRMDVLIDVPTMAGLATTKLFKHSA